MDLVTALKHTGNYLIYVSPPIVGVVIGGFIVQRYWVKKANESTTIEYLTKELSDLVDETIEYWSLDCSGTDKKAEEERKSARKLEARIKADIKNLNSMLSHYSTRYCKKAEFGPLMVEVSDACTGGQFEVLKRSSDPHRFMVVVNATIRVRAELIKRRV